MSRKIYRISVHISILHSFPEKSMLNLRKIRKNWTSKEHFNGNYSILTLFSMINGREGTIKLVLLLYIYILRFSLSLVSVEKEYFTDLAFL